MKLVCLAGIDGCGKSTQARHLVAALRSRGQRARAVGVWDLLADPELDTGSFMGTPEQFRGYLSRLGSTARCLFVFHALHESLRRAQSEGGDWLVAVGYWPKYAVVEELLGTPRALVEELARLFPAPERTLWLDLDPSLAAARREAFSRYECGGEEPSPAAFVAFQERCRARLGQLAEAHGWVRVDAAGDEATVAARLLEETCP